MKFIMNLIYSVFMFLLLSFFVGCNETLTESKTGVLFVLAIDNDPDETPVPDIEITVTPGDFVKNTDINGACFFELESGDYLLEHFDKPIIFSIS